MKSRKIRILGGIILALFFISAPAFGVGDEPPASVMIDSLSHLFEGVEFDHELHVEVTEGCAVCHHHRFGSEAEEERCAKCHSECRGTFSPTCSDCHVAEPFTGKHIRKMEADPNRYHIDVTGLKAAYHLKCLNCHIEEGAPSECVDCHQRTDAGNRFYRSGKYAPTGGNAGKEHE